MAASGGDSAAFLHSWTAANTTSSFRLGASSTRSATSTRRPQPKVEKSNVPALCASSSKDSDLGAASPSPSQRSTSSSDSTPHRLIRCRRCGQSFDPKQNFFGACRYHATVIGNRGYFTMVLETVKDPLKKQYRQRKYHRWTCCGGLERHEPGCKRGRHLSWDDEDERWEDDWVRPYGVWGHGMKQLK